MRIGTANIGRNQHTITQTKFDFARIKRVIGRGGVVGFQEIDEADDADEHEFLDDFFSNFTIANFSSRVPVALGPRYKIVKQDSYLGTKGIPHVSPNRLITVVIVQDRLRPWIKFAVTNGHSPAGAFNADKHERFEADRLEHWNEYYDNWKRIIDKLVDDGYTVFRTADDNRMDMPKLHRREVQLFVKGIDNVSYIEGSVSVDVLDTEVVALYSDHDLKYAKIRLKRKRKKT